MTRRILLLIAALAAFSCTRQIVPESKDDDKGSISAVKESWVAATKADDAREHAKDLPWKEGDKVMLLNSDLDLHYSLENSLWGTNKPSEKKVICTVNKIAGLKCTLVPDSPIESGTYRAFFPQYGYATYEYMHLSFLYEESLGLDHQHQDIVVSDPVTYQEGETLTIVMKHICALISIDIYPPKDGKYSRLKVFAQSPVFPGKAEIFLDRNFDFEESASGWLNYTTLRGNGKELAKDVAFPTTTGLLPYQYDGMPMSVHIVYQDGTHYVSEPFAMPNLSFGVENKLTVKDFTETSEPLNGLMGGFFGDDKPSPYPVN